MVSLPLKGGFPKLVPNCVFPNGFPDMEKRELCGPARMAGFGVMLRQAERPTLGRLP